MHQRTCPTCDTVFTPHHSRNIYCRPECRADPHPKVEVPCATCGTACPKEPSQVRKYAATFCSILCRDYARTEGRGSSCTIPRDHPARWWGASCPWTPPLLRNTGECDWCGEVNARDRSARFCSTRCKKLARRQRRRAAEYNAPGEFRYSQVMRQYQRQGKVCAYCQEPCSRLPDVEHVTPLSRGGRNDMSNIVAACALCNSDKRDLTLAEWSADRARRGKRPVRTHLTGPAFLHLV